VDPTRKDIAAEAARFAAEAHKGQRYGDLPYTEHLRMVHEVVDGYLLPGDSFREEGVAAAWLHDVLEDTPVGQADLSDAFGPVITDIVWRCTGIGPNRKARQAAILSKLTPTPDEPEWAPTARLVKVADRVSNVAQCRVTGDDRRLRMYRKESRAFAEALHVPGEWDPLWAGLFDLFDHPSDLT